MIRQAGDPIETATPGTAGNPCSIRLAAMLAVLLYILDSFIARAVGAGLIRLTALPAGRITYRFPDQLMLLDD